MAWILDVGCRDVIPCFCGVSFRINGVFLDLYCNLGDSR